MKGRPQKQETTAALSKEKQEKQEKQEKIKQLLIAAATRLIRSEHSQGNYDTPEIHQANKLIHLANRSQTDLVALTLAALDGRFEVLSKIVASYFHNTQDHSNSGQNGYQSAV